MSGPALARLRSSRRTICCVLRDPLPAPSMRSHMAVQTSAMVWLCEAIERFSLTLFFLEVTRSDCGNI